VRLLAMPNDPDPVAVGSEGTVVGGNGGQLWLRWDSGRTLSLIVGVDRYEVLPAEDEAPGPVIVSGPTGAAPGSTFSLPLSITRTCAATVIRAESPWDSSGPSSTLLLVMAAAATTTARPTGTTSGPHPTRL